MSRETNAALTGTKSLAGPDDARGAPETAETLTSIDRCGNRRHQAFGPSYSVEHQTATCEAMAVRRRMTYGACDARSTTTLMVGLLDSPEP